MNEIYDDLDELPRPPRKDIPAADRELLELAARAIGAVQFEEVEGEGYANLHFADGSIVYSWNPLIFSGDTFDLMVRLELDVTFFNGDTLVLNVSEGGGDPHERTRRAIVRATAEIGKTMNEGE